MILPFSTHFKDGTPTDFITKIWKGLFPFTDIAADEWLPFIKACRDKKLIPEGNNAKECLEGVNAKYHTIREDVKDRWQPGRLIHMVVFNRSKNQFQFAPVLVCTAVQNIEIYHHNDGSEVVIDGEPLNKLQVIRLAVNDGFEEEEAFFNYFNKDFSGKIIHWTDLRY